MSRGKGWLLRNWIKHPLFPAWWDRVWDAKGPGTVYQAKPIKIDNNDEEEEDDDWSEDESENDGESENDNKSNDGEDDSDMSLVLD